MAAKGVQIKLELKDGGFVGKTNADAKALKKFGLQAQKTSKKVGFLGSQVGKLHGYLGSLVDLSIIKSGLSAITNAFKVQEQAVAKLNASIASMNRTTPNLSKNLQSLASQIQQNGVIGDEALIEGASFLTTYSQITDDMLPRTISIMADFAAKMGGNTVQAAFLSHLCGGEWFHHVLLYGE